MKKIPAAAMMTAVAMAILARTGAVAPVVATAIPATTAGLAAAAAATAVARMTITPALVAIAATALAVMLTTGEIAILVPNQDKKNSESKFRADSNESALFNHEALGKLAQQLDRFYSEALSLFMGDAYSEVTLFEWARRYPDKENFSEILSLLDPTQSDALRFFLLGDSLAAFQLNRLLGGASRLVEDLIQIDLVIEKEPGHFKLNRLSLVALPTIESLYVLCDLPREWSDWDGEPTCQLASTSLKCLNFLNEGSPLSKLISPSRGTWVDYGAGTGILGIAAAVRFPDIKEIICVESDPHSAQLCRWNLALNQVSDRVTVLEATEPGILTRYLAGRRADFAISNFPGNPAPECLAGELTPFGDGGPFGLSSLPLFIEDVLPNLKLKGTYLLFSPWAKASDGKLWIEQECKNRAKGYSYVEHRDWTWDQMSIQDYVKLLKNYLRKHSVLGNVAPLLVAQDRHISEAFDFAGIRGLCEGFVSLTRSAST